MKDLIVRATVGAQVRTARSRSFAATRMRNDAADNIPVGVIIGIIIGAVVLGVIAVALFTLGDTVSGCIEGANDLVDSPTGDICP
jgi:hypothetical protein